MIPLKRNKGVDKLRRPGGGGGGNCGWGFRPAIRKAGGLSGATGPIRKAVCVCVCVCVCARARCVCACVCESH